MYKFEKLKIWYDAVELIELSYVFIRKLPKAEKDNLSDQLKRAVTSVALNIAEGSGAGSDVEFNRYLSIARKSLFETVAIVKIIERLYFIKGIEVQQKTDVLIKQIVSLQSLLVNRYNTSKQ